MESKTIVGAFAEKRILVLGDVMIDAYLTGKVNRVSPEAPVPIVSLKSKEERLGGAANVALNIDALGATPILVSVIGEDNEGSRFLSLMNELKMSTEGILRSENRMTTVKTRVLGNNQHLLRIDAEQTDSISTELEEALFQRIVLLCQTKIDAIIFEDYNKGVLSADLITRVIKFANENNIPTTVDPKKENFFAYKGVSLFKPNLKELKEGLNVEFQFDDKEQFEQAVQQLEKENQHEITFITLSEHGVFIKNQQEKWYLPAHLRNIADVSGAGDTVISVATLCLTLNLPINLIAAYANLAGGLVCEKVGVVSVNKEDLIREADKLIHG
jgi:D-glycero-beta-D-manno-heptose-7-phosphate kinase